MNYFEQVKQKTLLQLKYLQSGDQKYVKQINAVTDYQLSMIAPSDFDGESRQNTINAMELSFESLCTNLEELGIQRPKRLSVFEFYSKIRYFKAKNKPK